MKVKMIDIGKYEFQCPGCGIEHVIWTCLLTGGEHPYWEFNGNLEKPTFTPSLKIEGSDARIGLFTCHSFIRNGQILFQNDCTHELAGKTVDLPEIK